MDETPGLAVIWTEQSLTDSLEIKNYLIKYFTQREIDLFYGLLISFEKVVVFFPQLYPISKKNRQVRRAVLSKQLSVFYIHSTDYITVVAVLDNRMDYKKWP